MNSAQGKDYSTAIYDAWDSGDIVLFLGAGVSVPYGIPNWSDLVVELLLPRDHAAIASLTAEYRSALGGWIADWFDFMPVTLGRRFKPRRDATLAEKIAYHEKIRHALYQRRTKPRSPHHDILEAVCDLIRISEEPGTKSNIRAIVTSNFDDLLEAKLDAAGISYASHYTARRRERTSALPILHIHGYLPYDEKRWEAIDHDQRIVFSEDDYHHLTYRAFHWAIEEVTHFMRTATILFIGSSMRDPNVRRLLDATATPGSKCHYLFRKRYDVKDVAAAAADVQARAMRRGAPAVSGTAIELAIRDATSIAIEADEKTFAQMGAGVIWFDDFQEVADYLRQIAPIHTMQMRAKTKGTSRPVNR